MSLLEDITEAEITYPDTLCVINEHYKKELVSSLIRQLFSSKYRSPASNLDVQCYSTLAIRLMNDVNMRHTVNIHREYIPLPR